jgi:glyoxylase-like metal-dependent hydrolase (beta-lactamase superfamily II)
MRGNQYRRLVGELPTQYRRIIDGEPIVVGGRIWRVITGYGHAPEHASLYCEALGLVISGDMLLPTISTHVGVWPTDPEGDPLGYFLRSIRRYRELPAEVLVLPSHGFPFRGAHERVAQLEAHHEARLAELLRACGEAPRCAADVLALIFRRPLDTQQLFFAMGEAIAHLHYLERSGRLRRQVGADGVARFAPARGTGMERSPDGVKGADTARVLHEVAERSSRILKDFSQKSLEEGIASVVKDELGIAKAYMDLYSRLLMDPSALTAATINFWIDSMRLWQSAWLRMLGHEPAPVAQPAKGDPRFRDEQWSDNFLFDYVKQSYLIAARHIQHAVANVQGLPEDSQKKVAFFTRQYVDALAPSNFAATNPQVLRETLATGGQNLVKGLANLLADIEKGEGQLRISMTDESAFQLGRNVATTPGKVVFQNALLQLIQYQPTTETVLRRPLLIIPPWINKYYILDLRESNSFIRWAVAQGHTVFVVSWVNPDAKLAEKGFDDYLTSKARSPRWTR